MDRMSHTYVDGMVIFIKEEADEKKISAEIQDL